MKALNCLFWATLYCVLYLVRASEDDLLDFDFADAKDVDWNYENDAKLVNAQAEAVAEAAAVAKKIESNMLDFAVEFEDDDAQNHLPPFDWREKVLRNALAKALTDKALRQKFAEVMPILRLLSSQQRLALSALISAQMNAKKGQELKLDQVRMMFQDDKKLLLPIVYDLANLVKNSARKYIDFGNDLNRAELHKSVNERKFDLTSTEDSAEDTDVGTIRVTADNTNEPEELEDFFDKMPVDVLDPQSINEALQAVKDEEKAKSTNGTTTNSTATLKHRARRASNEFVHKLIRSMPASVNEEELMRGAAGRTIKLNTTAFEQPKEHVPASLPSAKSTAATTESTSSSNIASSVEPSSTQSYAEIENIAFADLNGTEFKLNPNERLDKVNSDELLPSPEELIAGPRYRLAGGNKLHSSNLRNKSPIKRKRVQARGRPKGSAPPPQLPPLTAASSNSPIATLSKKCERFTATMCIYTDDYPLDQIMGSIRRHKNAMSALLAEFYDKPNHNLEFGDEFDDYVVNKKRREDEGTAGGMCQSVVRYARPQKARSASGEWKYIVNTGQHTQTLRLEKCSNAGESCSYLAQTYRSHCSQVYNYHRLLSWDKLRGLHVDIFKVPTCCSCQVDGYRQQFPPLSSLQSKDFTPANYHAENSNGYSTINEDDLDYNDESDEDELGYVPAAYNSNSIGHQHKQSGQYEGNELYLSSKKVRTKVHAPPTVGSYLSPPDDEYREAEYGHKSGSRGAHSTASSSSSSSSSPSSSSHKKHYSQASRRRPHNEPRVDLDLSPSESYADKEVNIFGTPLADSNDKSRVSQKRKRIYSAPHTVSAGGAASSSNAPQQHQQPTVATSTAANSAAHAHQVHYQQHQQPPIYGSAAAATGAATSAPASSYGHVSRNYVGPFGSKSRPRFYAPGSAAAHPSTVSSIVGSSTSSAATTPSTQSPYQRYGTHSTALPAPPSIYHVNSIFSSSGDYNASRAHSPAAKRINYSYHPIIDFFDKNKRGDFADTEESTEVVDQPDSAHIFPHKISSSSVSSSSSSPAVGGAGFYQTSHERRIGFGAGAGRAGVGVGVGGFSHGQSFTDDNAWRPVVASP